MSPKDSNVIKKFADNNNDFNHASIPTLTTTNTTAIWTCTKTRTILTATATVINKSTIDRIVINDF